LTLRHGNGYGGFSADGWQYEIGSPSPPREWFNVLFNRAFLTRISQVGRGESLYVAPSINTVSLPHRAFYVRDRETGEWWSPTGAPAGGPVIDFRCIHRPDCTVIESERVGIGVRIRVFVPVEGTVSIWTITLHNHTAERRPLSLFSSIPMVMTDGRWPGEFYNSARYDRVLGAMVVRADFSGSPKSHKSVGYVAARPHPTHTDGSEEAFLGGAGRWDRPAAVEAGELSDRPGLRERVCAALQHDLVLDKGGSWTVHLAVGCEETRNEVASSAARFTDPDGVEALFEETWAFWQDRIGPGWLTTPDEEVDLALNIWLKRQLVMQVWGRRWLDFINIRNVLQDAVGLLPYDAEPCRAALLDAFSRQDANGFMPRDWPVPPPAAARSPLPSRDREGVRVAAGGKAPSSVPPGEAGHRDIPIWAAWALAAYVNETGDEAFLKETLPFRDRKRPVTILAHAAAGLRYLAEGVGRHGLCLFGGGDWCDPLEGAGVEGRGESVWTSIGLVFAARALAPVAERAGQAAVAEELAHVADRMSATVNAAAWDGAWYIRGYADDGLRFGTHGETEGRIYLNPQTWAVLAGVADAGRARLAMESVRENLETDYGTAVLAPAYTRYVPRIGRLTEKVPGTAENGAVYNHAVLFHACALASLGEGDRAIDIFRRILPTVRQHPVERSRHIPMWMPNYYVPPACEHGGLASSLYLTGTVPWCFIFIREYVFGVRPGPAGLTVRPCVPASWRECRMVRPFRGDEYDLTLRNPHGLQTGRVRLELDGRPIDGDVIPLVGDGRHHRVVVTLEPAAREGR